VSCAGLAYLTIAGRVVAFTGYVGLLNHAPGPLVASYTFVTPIIAVVLGWAFLGERLNAQMFIGMVLVIGSVIAVSRMSNPVSRRRGGVAGGRPDPGLCACTVTGPRAEAPL
jgi:drug/metabolite transporter (DMT)-like permease